MKNKLLLSAILVLLLGLMPSIAERSNTALFAMNVEDMLNYIPETAEGIIIINFAEASKKGLSDELGKYPDIMKGLKEAEKETGIDFWNDIHYIALVFNKFQKEDDAKLYALFNTTVGENKVLSVIKAKGKIQINKINIEGNRAYELDDGLSKSYFAFPSENMAIIAEEKDDFITGIEALKGKKGSIKSNPALSGIFNEVNKKHIIWGVIAIPEHAKTDVAAQQGPMAFFSTMRALYFGGSYDTKDLHIDINLYVSKPADAQTLVQTLEGLKGMGKMSVSQEKPELAKYFDLIMVTQETDTVKINLHLTQAQLDEIEKLAKEPKKSMEGEEKQIQ